MRTTRFVAALVLSTLAVGAVSMQSANAGKCTGTADLKWLKKLQCWSGEFPDHIGGGETSGSQAGQANSGWRPYEGDSGSEGPGSGAGNAGNAGNAGGLGVGDNGHIIANFLKSLFDDDK